MSAAKGRTVNRAELAHTLGVSLVTVDAYIRRGCPFEQRGSKGKEWKFDTAAVIGWLRDQDVQQAIGAPRLEKDEAQTRKLSADAQISEYELARLRRTMVSVDDMERMVADEYATVRARSIERRLRCRTGPCRDRAADHGRDGRGAARVVGWR